MASSSGTSPIHARGAISSDGSDAARQSPLSTASGTPKRPRGVSATATAASLAPFPPISVRSPATSPIAASRVQLARQGTLATLHPLCLGRRALVVVAQQMQHAVDQQPIELARERRRPLPGLPTRRVHRDDDVTQQPLGCAALPFDLRERQHVGGPVRAAPLPVQP